MAILKYDHTHDDVEMETRLQVVAGLYHFRIKNANGDTVADTGPSKIGLLYISIWCNHPYHPRNANLSLFSWGSQRCVCHDEEIVNCGISALRTKLLQIATLVLLKIALQGWKLWALELWSSKLSDFRRSFRDDLESVSNSGHFWVDITKVLPLSVEKMRCFQHSPHALLTILIACFHPVFFCRCWSCFRLNYVLCFMTVNSDHPPVYVLDGTWTRCQ